MIKLHGRPILERIANHGVHRTMQERAKVFRSIRQRLDDQGFVEVDTPVLYPYPEIAPMPQFKALDPTSHREYYLRVCPTEHLKRLMVAGYERVYEFSRNFRPGNTSEKHSSEFTSLECGQLSATYHDMMKLTENIVSTSIVAVRNDTVVKVQDGKFDLAPPWDRVTVRDAIGDALGFDILNVETLEELSAKVGRGELGDASTVDQAIDHLLEAVVLPKLRRPTFLTEYPYALGGPAKAVPGDPRVKQRCEAFVETLEIANMSTHLNNIAELMKWHEMFIQIKSSHRIGDAVLDEPLFDALSLGFPDSAVMGIGIDRLIMLATGAHSIEDVILFPFALL